MTYPEASEASRLKAIIRKAFGESRFPSDATLLYDERCSHDECLFIKRNFAKRNWLKVAASLNKYRDDIFNFFSAKAFAYYIPAFMYLLIDRYEEVDVMGDVFLEILKSAHVTEHERTYALGKLMDVTIPLTVEECEAVKLFLGYIWRAQRDECAEEALERFTRLCS